MLNFFKKENILKYPEIFIPESLVVSLLEGFRSGVDDPDVPYIPEIDTVIKMKYLEKQDKKIVLTELGERFLAGEKPIAWTDAEGVRYFEI